MERKNTNRIAKVNAKIQKELGEILHELMQGGGSLVTVSRVETSKDMKWVKVGVSILGGDDDKTLDFLKRHLYEIQGQLNEKFTTKVIPRIQFFLDTSPRYAQHIDELIHKIHEEREQ